MTHTVVVTQPYVPKYRLPLFTEVRRLLQIRSVELLVAAGRPAGAQAARADGAGELDWIVPLRQRTIRVGRRSIRIRQLPSRIQPQLLVSELEAANNLAWRWTLSSQLPMVLWGHGAPFVNSSPRLAERLEWALARRAAHIMTYSERGKEYLVREGKLMPDAVTPIGNSTDSLGLRTRFKEYAAKASGGVRPLSALYVGGLDAEKRIDFLLEAARAAAEIEPGFQLSIAGTGVLERDVRAAAEERSEVNYVGVANEEKLAELGSEADVMWVPGRVGLIAVDCLAMGLPLHTTQFRYHAPEIEFLRTHEVEYLENEPRAFATQSIHLARLYPVAKQRPLREDIPTVEAVAARFAEVVLASIQN